jgi:prepilin-type N-terminal cleavage/methylation domain-containing protein
MKARSAAYNSRIARRPAGRRGFTLIEVLVVLSILVILFAMLFAPMIASLDMVRVGQTKVTMQTSVRTAMEEMRREISNAMYIYPTPAVTLKVDGVVGNGDDIVVPNPSQIVFVSPQRTATGQVLEPLQPRADSTGRIVATRFRATLLDESRAYQPGNPFVLVREEGYYTRDEDATAIWWDFNNIGGASDPVRNVLTARGDFDMPPTRTICRACGAVVSGYAPTCPITTCASSDVIYSHDNLQFMPERIVGEVLQPSANNTIYQARYGAWAGFHNPGNFELNNLFPQSALPVPAQLGASPLDPRIVMVNPTDWSVTRDSYAGTDLSNTILTWNSDRGVIQVGATTGRWIIPSGYDRRITAGTYYPLTVRDARPDRSTTRPTDEYDRNGTLTSATRTWDIIPVYPSLGTLLCPACGTTADPTVYSPDDTCPACASGTLVSTAQPGDPAMPIAYRLDPTMGGINPPAKVVPGSVRVVLWAMDTAGHTYQTPFSETETTTQAEIGPRQFAVVLSDYDQRAEVRFNELQPPSPMVFDRNGDFVVNSADFGGGTVTLQSFGVYIQYYYRRNYDPTAPQNDYTIKVDYSTQAIMNLYLALQRYVEPQASTETPGTYVLPADATPDRVALHNQVRVRNLGQ